MISPEGIVERQRNSEIEHNDVTSPFDPPELDEQQEILAKSVENDFNKTLTEAQKRADTLTRIKGTQYGVFVHPKKLDNKGKYGQETMTVEPVNPIVVFEHNQKTSK